MHFTATDSSGTIPISEDNSANVFFNCPAYWTLIYDNASPKYHCRREVKPQPPCNCKTRKPNEPAPDVGNPIVVASQTKVETAQDYTDASGELKFERTYRSDNGRWVHNWDVAALDPVRTDQSRFPWLCYYDETASDNYCYRYTFVQNRPAVQLVRPDGPKVMFGLNGGYLPPASVNDRVTPVTDAIGSIIGWQVTDGDDGSINTFDAFTGKLLTRQIRGGKTFTLSYSDANTPAAIAPTTALLLSVRDNFARQLSFTYDAAARVKTMTDPDGHVYLYGYDAVNGDLTSVTYPDGKVRKYVYGEAANMSGAAAYHALTGVIDENDQRYATFKYSNRLAWTSEHAGGVFKYSVTAPNYSTRTVTDPLGQVATYTINTYTSPVADFKIAAILRPSAAGSGSAQATWSYDANLNVSSTKAFDGSITNFTYDLSRNLETSRTEAAGTPEARTISTAWHPSYRLPLMIAEPKRLTTLTYDAQGRMLTRTEQATTDQTGSQGLNPSVTGQPRTWTWTYNQYGQVLTMTGPRTDVADTVTYTYDAAGNLATVTNALGHATTYSNYDGSGRVGRIVAPNGLVTEFSYTLRGWLATSTVSDGATVQTTTYDYDAVGQLLKATFADGAWLSYTYDPAHRLTGISDSAGNSVSYTLDNAGNRVSEKTTDVNGALTRQITRVYDVLNNMKQTTGAPQ